MLQHCKRVLVVLPSWIGDAVMASPVYRALRNHLPDARLIALLRPGLDELIEGTQWFDEVVKEQASKGGVTGPLRCASMIRRVKPDAAVLLPNSFRSALTVWLARVPLRIGYARDGRSVFLTHGLTAERSAAPQSIVPYYGRIACAALEVDSIEVELELACSEAQREAGEKVLPSTEVGGPLVILNPGANRADKRWPAERFAGVGDALVDSHGAAVAVSGSPAEADIVARVCAASRSGAFVNLVERGIQIGSLKALIERAALVVSNDTGPRHIALALGTDVVSLFGPTDVRWTRIDTAPGREHPILAEPFLPEDRIADQHSKACAIDRIATGDVIHVARKLLHSTSRPAIGEPVP